VQSGRDGDSSTRKRLATGVPKAPARRKALISCRFYVLRIASKNGVVPHVGFCCPANEMISGAAKIALMLSCLFFFRCRKEQSEYQ